MTDTRTVRPSGACTLVPYDSANESWPPGCLDLEVLRRIGAEGEVELETARGVRTFWIIPRGHVAFASFWIVFE